MYNNYIYLIDLILTMTNSSYLFIHQSVHLSTVFIISLMSYSSFYLFIIISLADGELYSADLAQFAHKPALPRTRNVSCFAVDWHKLKSNETINSTYYLAHKFNNVLVYKTCFSGYQPELRICVATKKKILVFSYRNQNFITSVSIVYSIDIYTDRRYEMCMWRFIVQVYCRIITNNGTEPSL